MKGIQFDVWFGRAVWLGILVNCIFAVPAMFVPNAALALTGQTQDLEHPVWPAAASMLLVLLSIFYIPGAIDPRRYKATAILSVVARLSGSSFFLLFWRNTYPYVGYVDLFFLILEAPLLYLALRQQSQFDM
jgi:hypothetical protein